MLTMCVFGLISRTPLIHQSPLHGTLAEKPQDAIKKSALVPLPSSPLLFSLPWLLSQRSRFGQSWGTEDFESNNRLPGGDERSALSNQGPEAENTGIQVRALVEDTEEGPRCCVCCVLT